MNGAEETSFVLPRLGVTLRGKRTADHGGLPVLCVHGWLDNCDTFLPLISRMPGAHMVAIDLPGHGLSDPGPGAVYDVLGYAMCVLELAHSLGWQRFQLIGHSMGGVVCAIAAAIHPDKVQRLVLLDIIESFTLDSESFHARVASYLDAYLRDAPVTPYATVEQAVEARARLGDMALRTAQLLSGRDLMPVEGGFSWRTDRRLKYPFVLGFDEERMHTFLRQITAPTLRVDADRAVPRKGPCRDMALSVRNLRTTVIAGGHHLHVEEADRVADVIRPFLSVPAPSHARSAS